MGLTETLRLLIDADTRGAVSGIEKVGATTQKELGKSQQSIDKWASGLTNAGAAMIGVGGAALFGLGKAAQASEEAHLATVKLQNTLNNMPKLAGENSKQFTDLAAAIQKKTAADGDAIVAGEAMLGTFRLTADEIKSITPLVVDYSRKFGVDMVDASVQVGKALDGNVGALKRNGVSIDEAAFAADHFTAVQSALREQVGGFAEEEGKTFAGSVERMKNELGDLAEGVGGGAVDAFTKMFGVIGGVTDKLNDISPGAQNAAGEIATFASVGLVAAGSVSFLIGQAIKAQHNFAAMGDAAIAMGAKVGLSEVAISRLGGALRTLGTVGAVVTALALLREALGTVADEAKRTDLSQLQNELLDLAKSGEASGATLKRVFEGLDVSTPEKWAQAAADLDQLDKALAQLAGRDPEAAAAAFKSISQALREGGASADQVKGVFDSYAAALSDADVTNRTSKDGIEGTTGALGDQATAAEDAKSALEEYADALNAQFDPLFGMISALNGTRDAQVKVAEAQGTLNEALAGGDPTAIAEAQRAYDDALFGASESLVDAQVAQAKLNDAVNRGDITLSEAKDSLIQWALNAGFTAEEAQAMAAKLDGATTAAQTLDAQNPTVDVTVRGADEGYAKIITVRDALGQLHDKTLTIGVTTALGGQAVAIMESKLFRAAGGPVQAGLPYIVGEKGPEWFVPDTAGTIIPHGTPMASGPSAMASGGGMGRTMVVHIGQVVANDPVTLVEQLKRYERVNGTGWRN